MTYTRPAGDIVPARTWIAFVAMCAGMFMAILDIQVVASSLPAIAHGLAIPEDKLSWIQTSYLIAEIIAIPLSGILTRAMSVRWLFAGSTAAFTLASIGCALSHDFASLIVLRSLQGFCGGSLIPSVFTSIFALFPERREALATTIAGAFAMIAPSLGPALGGWLTQHYSWHAIFLVNVLPGAVVTVVVAALLRIGAPNWKLLRHLDYVTLLLTAIFLAALQLALKQGPPAHWRGWYIWLLCAICLAAGVAAIRLCLTKAQPFVDLRRLRDRHFAVGCALSFVLGMGLYGSTYLLPVFLGFVRGHAAFDIGKIMMVTGVTQLFIAPIAAWLETRMDARWLALTGFALFAAGLAANGFETPRTDFDGLFWPQVLRGAAMMLCILPATRLALNGWAYDELADASALFNLMRNLGGAIAIGIIDTILEQRTPGHVAFIVAQLQAGSRKMAAFVGLPLQFFHDHAEGTVDAFTKQLIEPLVKKAGAVMAFNEAWLLLACFFVFSLLFLPFCGRESPPRG